MTQTIDICPSTFYGTVVDINNAMDNLAEFLDSLPAPDADGASRHINHRQLAALMRIRRLMGQIAKTADVFDAI